MPELIKPMSYIDQIKQCHFNMDDNQMGYFARQLELIEAQALQIVYPQLKATALIPVQTYAGMDEWAKTQTYRQFNHVGKAKVIADWGQDFSQVGVNGAEYTGKFVVKGDSYEYNYEELQQSMRTNINLPNELAFAAKQAIDEAVDDHGWYGNAASGITGFLNNPDVPRTDVPADGTGSSTLWSTKTGIQMYRDMVQAISDVNTISNGVESADTLILPLEQYNLIENTAYDSDNSSDSVLTVFKRNRPGILVDYVLQLKEAGTASKDIMVAYTRNPMKVNYRLPIPFMQFPLYNKGGTVFEVKMLCRMGDVVFKFPKSANIKEGI